MSDNAAKNGNWEPILASQLTRRAFLGYAATSAVAFGLLAACEADDDDDEDVGAVDADEPDPEDDDEPDPEDDDEPDPDEEDPDESVDELDGVEEFDNPEPGTPVGDKPEELVIAFGVPQIGTYGLDPQLHGGTMTESTLRHMYECLVTFGRDLESFEPALATDWERLDEYTMQFRLREGVKFHNGEDFDAHAAEFSIWRPLSDETPGAMRSDFDILEDVEVVDDYTINVVTTDPDPVLLNRFSGFHMTMVAPEWASQGPEVVASEVAGTGPYRLVSWSPEEDVVMEANQDYWGDVPDIERVRMTYIAEDSTRVSALRTGEVHVATDMPPEQISQLEADDGVRYARAMNSRIVFYHFSVDYEPWDDVRLRQAVNYAVDMETIVDTILEGNGVPVRTVLAEGSLGHNEELEIVYDPERAQELLEEAGYPDGIDLDFWFSQGRVPKDQEVGEAICLQLQASNIRCTPHVMPWDAYGDARQASEIVGLSFNSLGNVLNDPDGMLARVWSCAAAEAVDFDLRRPYGCNEELDEVIHAGRTELDEQRRHEIYQEAQRILYEDAAALWAYQVVDIHGVNDWVLWEPRNDEMVWAHDMSWNE